MADLKALLFDVDGTLADTERDGHRVAFNRAFEEAGLDWHWSEELYGKLLAVTGGKERMRFYLNEFNTAFQLPENGDEFIADLHKSKTRHFTDMLKEGKIPLRTGVKRLLTEAKNAGLRLAVATTTTPENVSTLLQSTLGDDWQSYFEVIAAGDIVPNKKPAPDIYVWAMQQMSLDPVECLALEDSANGVKSVIGAKIPTLVVTVNGYTRNEDFTGASLIVDQFGDADSPSSVISGSLYGDAFVTIEALRTLHGEITAG
jgi:beta-phosphoglucomutase-like phosphatase (HAD superfamily)